MKRYFRRDAESDLGEGTVYLEVTDGLPSRQAEVYGGEWRWGDAGHPAHLADQPLEALGLESEHAITAEEFELAWRQALTGWRPPA
ncbi:MAG: hypothetical protein QM704_11875 [Anaeromyxobacteraceae bacterium]